MNYMVEIQGRGYTRKLSPRGRKNIYPFPVLAQGASFIHPRFNTARALVGYWHKKLGHRYDVIQIGVGARIQRVA